MNRLRRGTTHKKTTGEDTPVSIKVLHGDTDPDKDDTPATLVVALANGPRNGSVTLDPNNAGALIYVPKANFSGTDTFTYRISDGQFSSNGTVTVAIQAVNDEPTFPMDPAGAGGQLQRRRRHKRWSPRCRR